MQENYIVGIYARLSRDDERAGESVSIENQKEMLSRYVREQVSRSAASLAITHALPLCAGTGLDAVRLLL